MAITIIVIICAALMALFFGVTIAGGRAHDRQNAEIERRRLEREREHQQDGDRP